MRKRMFLKHLNTVLMRARLDHLVVMFALLLLNQCNNQYFQKKVILTRRHYTVTKCFSFTFHFVLMTDEPHVRRFVIHDATEPTSSTNCQHDCVTRFRVSMRHCTTHKMRQNSGHLCLLNFLQEDTE